jgi:hypothetical protein
MMPHMQLNKIQDSDFARMLDEFQVNPDMYARFLSEDSRILLDQANVAMRSRQQKKFYTDIFSPLTPELNEQGQWVQNIPELDVRIHTKDVGRISERYRPAALALLALVGAYSRDFGKISNWFAMLHIVGEMAGLEVESASSAHLLSGGEDKFSKGADQDLAALSLWGKYRKVEPELALFQALKVRQGPLDQLLSSYHADLYLEFLFKTLKMWKTEHGIALETFRSIFDEEPRGIDKKIINQVTDERTRKALSTLSKLASIVHSQLPSSRASVEREYHE